MKKLQCELCGSTDIVKTADDLFRCQHCGCKYTTEQAKMLLGGTVEVTLGGAEMQRRLKNAQTRVEFGDYSVAQTMYDELIKEYTDQNEVWSNALHCEYLAYVKGGWTLDRAAIDRINSLYKRALLTGSAPAQLKRENDAFYIDFVKGAMSKQCKLDIVDLFRYVYRLCKSTSTKPELLMNNNLWNFIASGISAGVLSGHINLKYDVYTNRDPDKIILNYEDLAMLASMHPKLNEMVNRGYGNARELNSGNFRLGHYYDDRYGWKFGGVPATAGLESELFVEIEFALSGIAFGSYITKLDKHGSYDPTLLQEHRHEALPISYDEHGQPVKDQFNHTWDPGIRCPYCGRGDIKYSKLFGHKCTNKKCGRRY